MYKLTHDNTIINLETGSVIPIDIRNNDYQEYLKWISEGNEPIPAPEILPTRDYIVFWNSLISSNLYSFIREQSMLSLQMNTLVTEFIALIGDAKSGRPNEVAIQSSMNAILTTGTFTEEHIAELQNALILGNLNTIYNLAV